MKAAKDREVQKMLDANGAEKKMTEKSGAENPNFKIEGNSKSVALTSDRSIDTCSPLNKAHSPNPATKANSSSPGRKSSPGTKSNNSSSPGSKSSPGTNSNNSSSPGDKSFNSNTGTKSTCSSPGSNTTLHSVSTKSDYRSRDSSPGYESGGSSTDLKTVLNFSNQTSDTPSKPIKQVSSSTSINERAVDVPVDDMSLLSSKSPLKRSGSLKNDRLLFSKQQQNMELDDVYSSKLTGIKQHDLVKVQQPKLGKAASLFAKLQVKLGNNRK